MMLPQTFPYRISTMQSFKFYLISIEQLFADLVFNKLDSFIFDKGFLNEYKAETDTSELKC